MADRPDIGTLERIAREVAANWGLALEPPYALSRHSYVAPAGDAVLKVTPVEDDESDEEAEALELWNGDGAVRLLRRDDGRRAIRMRRDVTERRLAAFAAAGLDEERMRIWAVIRGAYLGADDAESAVLRTLL